MFSSIRRYTILSKLKTMKEFKVGQAVFLVTPAEIMGLNIKGSSIIPATIVNQASTGAYNVTLKETLGNKIIVNIDADVIHSTVKEASDQCIHFVTAMVEEEVKKLKDLASANELDWQKIDPRVMGEPENFKRQEDGLD